MTDTAMQTVQRHMDAIAAQDLDAIMDTYADDAVLADTDRIGRGRAFVRAAHAEVLEAAGDLHPELQVLEAGDVVFVAWRAAGADRTEIVGTNTFVVSDGLITVNTTFKAVNPAAVGRLAEGLV